MNHKEFILLLSSYQCNKNCPYCIAKMERLPEVKDDFSLFHQYINKLAYEGKHFQYFILSGNGEPSLYAYDDLRKIVEITKHSRVFNDFRIQTSGNLFFEKDKFELFKHWLIEITRTHQDYNLDSKLLNYDLDYLSQKYFTKARIRLNIVLLKESLKNLPMDIITYFEKYPNIEVIALKMLDLQTHYNNQQTRWILEHGLSYKEIDLVKTIMSNRFKYLGHNFDNHLWEYNGKVISMFSDNEYEKNKSIRNILWHGNRVLV